MIIIITTTYALHSTNTSSPRTELLINIDNHPDNQLRGSPRKNSSFDVRMSAGLRVGNWKLITGNGIGNNIRENIY